LWQGSGLEVAADLAHIGLMKRWLKIALIVAGIFTGWVALSVLTFDDSVQINGVSE
jgi:hypothetical protein